MMASLQNCAAQGMTMSEIATFRCRDVEEVRVRRLSWACESVHEKQGRDEGTSAIVSRRYSLPDDLARDNFCNAEH
jgi:hypothetical protein